MAIREPTRWVCCWHHATDSNWRHDDGDGGKDGDGGDDGIVLGTYNQNEIGCSAKMLIIKIVSVVIFETSSEVQNEC